MSKPFQCCRVTVEVPDRLRPPKTKILFRNTIESDTSVSFDFQKLIDAFSILYPKEDIQITFTLC